MPRSGLPPAGGAAGDQEAPASAAERATTLGRGPLSGYRVAMTVGNPPFAGFAAVHLSGPKRVGTRLAVNRDRGVLQAGRVGHVARYVAGLQVEGV